MDFSPCLLPEGDIFDTIYIYYIIIYLIFEASYWVDLIRESGDLTSVFLKE